MSVYATLDQLEARFGPIPVADQAGAQDLLDTAEAKIAQRVPTLADRITLQRTNPVLVRNVVLEMVCAVLRNPTPGVRSSSRTEGAFSESRTFDTATAAGRLGLTRSQLYDLGDRRGAQTVPVGDDALRQPLRNPSDDGICRVFAGVAPLDDEQLP